MKTYSHYTTPIMAMPWMRRGVWALAALLVLAAVSFALIYALRLSFNPWRDIPAAPARPAPIGSCRACQDEWYGAMQHSRVTFAPSPGSELRQAVPAPVLPAPRQHDAVSRVFRDEVLGADQANLAWLAAPSAPVLSSSHQHGIVPRVFRDEMLGADQANLGSITLSGGIVLESQPDQRRKSGPR